MKQLTALTLLTFLVFACKEKPKTTVKTFEFPQVGWTIEVPSDLTVMDSAQIEALTKKGTTAIEKTYDTEVDFKATKTLIGIGKGRSNHFGSTVTPFDPAQDGDWNEVNSGLKEIMVETIMSQAPSMKFDTASSVVNIDGKEFRLFQITLTYPNNTVLNTFHYSKLHNGYDHGITITYTDKEIGKRFKEILMTSRFTK